MCTQPTMAEYTATPAASGFRLAGRCGEPALERPLEMRPRPCADHGLARLAVLEQDHRRDREDVVPGSRLQVLVDVQLHERDRRLLLLELLQDRRDRAAGAAPRSPEVDDDRSVGAENVLLEVRIRDLAHARIVARPTVLRSDP